MNRGFPFLTGKRAACRFRCSSAEVRLRPINSFAAPLPFNRKSCTGGADRSSADRCCRKLGSCGTGLRTIPHGCHRNGPVAQQPLRQQSRQRYRGQRKPNSVVVAIAAPAFVVVTVAVVISLVAAAIKSMTSAPVVAIPAAILNDVDILRRLSDLRESNSDECC